MFERCILPISEDVMLRWRLPVEAGRKSGPASSQPDLIMAATALHIGLTVVARDTRKCMEARAPALNPWTVPEG